jgi:hypothetical protein
MKKSIFVSLLMLTPLAASAADAYAAKTFPAAGVREIDVATDGGAVSLTAVEGATIAVDVSPAAVPGDDCRIVARLDGATLTLSARASGGGFLFGGGKKCSAGFAVSAPPRAAIRAASGSGNVVLGAFSGECDVKTGSGEIALRGPSGALTLRSGGGRIGGDASGPRIDAATGGGDVILSSLTGSASVKTGSGAVFLSWTSAPKSGAIDVRTGSGSLAILLPAATRLKTSLKSGSGMLHNEFGSDETAPLALTFRSGSGGATLRKAP